MNRSILAIAVASLLPHTSYLHAQETSADETMVVTASRFESKVSDSTAPISIVTKEEIAAIQAVSLADVLQRLPGVQIVTGGGYGKSTEIYVRGTSSRHQLFLINGIRIGSATLGSADISQIPLNGIERIEVIRGPRASVYGSDAIGGVINIITTSNVDQNSAQVGAGVGSHGFYQANVSGQIQFGEKGWGRVAVSTQANDGFSALPLPYEQDDDGFESNDVSLELGTQWGDYVTARVFGTLHDGNAEYDAGGFSAPTYTVWENSPNRRSESDNYNVAAKLDYQRDRLASELSIAKNRDNSTNLDDDGYNSVFKTERVVINWFNHYQINEQFKLGAGYEHQDEEVYTNGDAYTLDERSNDALYALLQYSADAWGLEGSARTDDSDAHGRENTWQVGAYYTFIPQLTWSVSTGTAFKAPTFNDLYYPEDSWGNVGNPDVKPEKSQHIESSLYGVIADVYWRATGYKTSIDDLISWEFDSATFKSMPENVNKAEIKGFELELDFFTGDVNHTLSYDFTDAKDTETGKYLVRRAKHNAKWNIAYLVEQWRFDLSTLYRGDSYNDSDNSKRLDEYILLDAAIGYSVTDNLLVKGKVTNLTDESYINRLDYNGYAYNTAGREFYLNASYQF
ncbi:hypothetical protein TW81_12755 [Vibrio galatheae]|uniref:Cobalamin receptor n=1 Tax=Vibrio galatheae TaxID=579748 RepID=A0A0F4NI01_9VIBR|nr:TonB-dependent receptor [Vibrio galatheae]KJY82554.1 hypothetical protein TW81_12755 [Vibrio galatheae]